jgi:chemotaxis protein CheX
MTELNIGLEIIEATREVFSTMIMMDVEADEPMYGKGEKMSSNISSMLGLGGGIRGMLAVHCPGDVATGITSGFLGMDVEEIDEDVKDALGEVANMVAGNLKIYFANQDIDISLAIPTSVIGKSYRTTGIAGATRTVVPFTIESGRFWVELLFVIN